MTDRSFNPREDPRGERSETFFRTTRRSPEPTFGLLTLTLLEWIATESEQGALPASVVETLTHVERFPHDRSSGPSCPRFDTSGGLPRLERVTQVVVCDMTTTEAVWAVNGMGRSPPPPSSPDPQPSRVCFLNLANGYNCGGGFERIAGSQEEDLFHTTSLAASLWPVRRRDDDRWPQGDEVIARLRRLGATSITSGGGDERATDVFYPFADEDALYSPTVLVDTPGPRRHETGPKISIAVGGGDLVDGGGGTTSALSPATAPPPPPWVTASCVSIAAQDLRRGRRYNANETFDLELCKAKIRTALFAAKHHGHQRLVLGALGCGAFQNPPRQVARAFHAVLTSEEFFSAFDLVMFAIAFSRENLDAFASQFYGTNVSTALRRC